MNSSKLPQGMFEPRRLYRIATIAKVTPVQNKVLLRAEHKPGNIITVHLHE